MYAECAAAVIILHGSDVRSKWLVRRSHCLMFCGNFGCFTFNVRFFAELTGAQRVRAWLFTFKSLLTHILSRLRLPPCFVHVTHSSFRSLRYGRQRCQRYYLSFSSAQTSNLFITSHNWRAVERPRQPRCQFWVRGRR